MFSWEDKKRYQRKETTVYCFFFNQRKKEKRRKNKIVVLFSYFVVSGHPNRIVKQYNTLTYHNIRKIFFLVLCCVFFLFLSSPFSCSSVVSFPFFIFSPRLSPFSSPPFSFSCFCSFPFFFFSLSSSFSFFFL